jgi:deoxyribodipyrimidine photolyase-related protein
VKPRPVHEWYLAMCVDAVEWIELPNTLGMSQHADEDEPGGVKIEVVKVHSGKDIRGSSLEG